jgi:hypothetical protein
LCENRQFICFRSILLIYLPALFCGLFLKLPILFLTVHFCFFSELCLICGFAFDAPAAHMGLCPIPRKGAARPGTNGTNEFVQSCG